MNNKVLKNRTSQRLISAFFLFAVLAPFIMLSKPKAAEAIPVFDVPNTAISAVNAGSSATTSVAQTTETSLSIKEWAMEISRQVLMNVAKRFLQEMTKSTINWINTGFHGNPLFLENPQSFFKDIAKYEIKNVVSAYGYDSRKFPFGKDFSLNIINSYKRQASDNAAYTLSRVVDDPNLLRSYRNDFNVGGWNGFLVNTQYPQNNYVGFNMLATDQLARKLEGTVQNKAQQVQTTLQQGMGFLSPQTCPSNPKYNNLKNEFQKPSFKPKTPPPTDEVIVDCNTGGIGVPGFEDEDDVNYRRACEDENKAKAARNRTRQEEYGNAVLKEQVGWSETNYCPGGLVSTTPGSVVADQIKNAMGSQFRQSELAGAMGNSISAILDSLVNHFMNKGLNALATKTNPKPQEEAWDYLGNTLGSPNESGVNTTWASGPDEPVVLSEFRKLLEDGINNTTTELALMDNSSATNPGISQMLGQIWPKARELDMCIPGPDLNWEKRTDKEKERNASKLLEKSSDDDPEEAARAQLTYKELEFAVDFFKDWVNNKMISELPNSIIYMDAVDEIRDLSQQSDELTDNRRAKAQALARLKSIQTALAAFTDQPEPGSAQERTLVSLKKQYNAVNNMVSNSFTVEERRNELTIAKEKFEKLRELTTQCTGERAAKGWTRPGGRSSTYLDQGTEQNLFCDFPIKGGYDHDSFKHSNDGGEGPGKVTHPDVPYVNANRVFRFDRAFGSGTTDIEMNCNLIYKSTVLDYKGNLPGATLVSEPPGDHPPTDDNGGGGGDGDGDGNGDDDDDGGGTGTPPNPNYTFPPGVCATDMEIDQFLTSNPGDQSRLPQAFPCS